MKKSFLFIAALAASLMLVPSCKKELAPSVAQPAETGTLEVSFTVDGGPDTKAGAAYMDAKTYEAQINKVQVFVFGATGNLEAYKDCGTATTSGELKVKAGNVTAFVVVNGAAITGVTTLAQLQAKVTTLADNSVTAATGFIMAGSAAATVNATGANNCAVTVTRIAARVALMSITNNLPAAYGAVTFKCAYLSNVVGNQNLAATAAPATWYNQEGRKDEATRNTDHKIDGTTYVASCPTLTFHTGSNASIANGATLEFKSGNVADPQLYYCYPNNSTTAINGFHSTFAAQRTVLSVVLNFNGRDQYYPVELNKSAIDRNTTHTVYLTITGEGSTGPVDPIVKGAFTVNVAVGGWAAGQVYDATF